MAPRLHTLLSVAVDVRVEEVGPLTQAFSAFFCILFAYNLLLPLRDEAGISLGTNILPTLFLLSLVVAIFVAPLAAALVSRPGVSKEKAVSHLYYCMGTLVLGFYLFYAASASSKGVSVTSDSGMAKRENWPGETNLGGRELVWTTEHQDQWSSDIGSLHWTHWFRQSSQLARSKKEGGPGLEFLLNEDGQFLKRLESAWQPNSEMPVNPTHGFPGLDAPEFRSPGRQALAIAETVRKGDPEITFVGRCLRGVFFLWVGIQNLVALSTMWARCADIFASDAGARLFGFIGAGATLGQLAGSFTARSFALRLAASANSSKLAKTTPPYQLILLSSVLLFFTGWLASCLKQSQGHTGHKEKTRDRNSPTNNSTVGTTGTGHNRSSFNRLWEGFAMIGASPYLLHLCGYLVLNYGVASLFYFEKSLIVSMSVRDSNSRAAWFATVNMYSGAMIALIQLTATGRLIKFLGMPCSLAITPACALLGMVLVATFPVLDTIGGAEVFRKVVTYAISRPAREVLFTVVSQEEKYKAKLCIDTVIQRLGDSMGAGVFQVVEGTLGLGPRSVASWGSLLCVAWGLVAYTLGLKNQAMAAAQVSFRQHWEYG